MRALKLWDDLPEEFRLTNHFILLNTSSSGFYLLYLLNNFTSLYGLYTALFDISYFL